MTTSEALLAAVLANPQDDLPRLVYADYLEENGEAERAEFIRVQCELAKVKRDRVKELETRENELHWFGWREWGQPASRLVPDGGHISSYVKFRRGFVAEVTCTLSQWCVGGNRTCTRCNYVAEHPWEDRCPSCNSHRLLQYPQGIGPAVVRSHPVEVVRIEGGVSSGVGVIHPWHRITRETVGPLWEFLDTIRTDYQNFDYVELIHLDAAYKMVSDAAIAWAKSQLHHARITSSPIAVDVTA